MDVSLLKFVTARFVKFIKQR